MILYLGKVGIEGYADRPRELERFKRAIEASRLDVV
jgi:hypothetical protein